MQVDIYDFDKTAVPFDSAVKYWGFCILHCPWLILLLPLQIIWGLLMLARIISVQTCKKWCFCYIVLINNKKVVKKFWDKYQSVVYEWFQPQNRARTSVVISASPDFLIDEIAERFGVEYCICTRHNPKTGKIIGNVCRKQEKVVRFCELLPSAEVVDVYSDNPVSDKYIFELGKRCLLAQNGELIEFTLDNIPKSVSSNGFLP